jgi:hypothetical protein
MSTFPGRVSYFARYARNGNAKHHIRRCILNIVALANDIPSKYAEHGAFNTQAIVEAASRCETLMKMRALFDI